MDRCRFHSWICQMLAVLLAFTTPALAQNATIQEQVVLIPTGSVVEVRMLAKAKLRGRLGALTQDAFELQTATGAKIQTESIRFDSVKSIKSINTGKGMTTTGKVVLGVLAGIGVFFIIVIAVAAATWD